MKEEFLHYIWQNKLYTNKEYLSNSGDLVEIIDNGTPNFDAGPDFFNAKIKTGKTIWAGNVEIHTKSSDWNLHSHEKNKLYDNVILHVVRKNDSPCYNSIGNLVSTIELDYPEHLYQNYNHLQNMPKAIPCENKIPLVDSFHISMWIENLAIERIQSKTQLIVSTLNANKSDWEESFFQILARSYGFGVNSDPFEQLAKSIPYKIFLKHRNSLSDIEALLFGQSGILELNEINDDYTKKLHATYLHLINKYHLKPIEGFTWKFLRLRPGNFPTVRIGQFASLIYNSTHLLSKAINSTNVNDLSKLFESTPSAYWTKHYHFNKESALKIKAIGTESIKSIIINTVIPFLYLYGEYNGKEELKERSLDFLNQISTEKNSIIQQWKKIGIRANTSFESQALIQLKKEYCDKKKCLQCKIGNAIITRE